MNASRVEAEFRSFLLGKVVEDWLAIAPGARPETFWIGEHESTDEPDSHLSTPIMAGWYFDGREFHERPASGMAAFANLAAGYPYTTGRFEIGIGGFARIGDSEEVALYWQFGGLHGLGYRCYSGAGRYFCDEAWRS